MNILNIKNQNIEVVIKESIKEVKEELQGLDYNQTCLIYSSYLYEILKRKNILVHLINTLDLGYSFLHQFLLVYDGFEYFLIDLTYRQFSDDYLDNLKNFGYIKVDNNIFNYYLKVVTNNDLSIDLDDAFTKKGR